MPLLLCDEPVPNLLEKYQWIDLRNVVIHKCDHDEKDLIIETVDPRYIMPPKPGVMGYTYWDTLYSPDEYLEKIT